MNGHYRAWSAAKVILALAVAGSPRIAEAQVVTAPSSRAPQRRLPRGDVPRVSVSTTSIRQLWRAVPSIGFGRLDLAKLAAEDAVRDAEPGVPMRVGVNRKLPGDVIGAGSDGAWEQLPDGRSRWRLRIDVPDGEALRVHFSRFDLPDGGSLKVVGNAEGPSATYRRRGLRQLGDFWSTATAGPVLYLEYVGPARDTTPPLIEIDELSQLYRKSSFVLADAGQPEGSAALLPCHVDVNCRGPDHTARDSVARILFTVPTEGTFLCSGALLSDMDANTFAGYFLTANHCIDDQPTASTLIAYWFYQTASCNGAIAPLSTVPRSEGAELLATGEAGPSSDFTLLRLYDDPHDGQGFAAWTNAVVSLGGVPVKGIHHPGGSWKRYAGGATTSAAPICCSPLCTTRFIYNDWTPGEGITEGGSSGSPLFNSDWEVIGQLYGSCYFSTPGCNNPSSYNNVYGRFTSAYPSISSYLSTVTSDDEHEDNDTLGDAVPLDFGQYALRLVDFDDYFAWTVSEDTELAVKAMFDNDIVNVDLHLYTADGVLLGSSTSNSDTEELSQTVGAGTYVLQASRDGGRGGDYALEVQGYSANCVPPAAPQPEPGGSAKNRFISFVPGNGGMETGIRVTLVSLQVPDPPNPPGSPPPDFSAYEGQVMWVGPPATYSEGGNLGQTFQAARLQCEEYYQDWGDVGLLHVYGPEIVPSSTYDAVVVERGCNPATAGSASLVISTTRWGDVVSPFSPESPGQPTFQDIMAVVEGYKGLPTAVIVPRARLQPGLVDPETPINFLDISSSVNAYKSLAYPFAGLTSCP